MAWTFDRVDRLRELAARAHRRAELLRRQRCGLPKGSRDRAGLARQIHLVEDRRDRLRTLARVTAHNARWDAAHAPA